MVHLHANMLAALLCHDRHSIQSASNARVHRAYKLKQCDLRPRMGVEILSPGLRMRRSSLPKQCIHLCCWATCMHWVLPC